MLCLQQEKSPNIVSKILIQGFFAWYEVL